MEVLNHVPLHVFAQEYWKLRLGYVAPKIQLFFNTEEEDDCSWGRAGGNNS